MWKAIVLRAARPWGSRLVELLLEAGVEVVAHSHSERKLKRLKEGLNFPPRLHAERACGEPEGITGSGYRGAGHFLSERILNKTDEDNVILTF
jgi:hypothetical protein